MTSGGRQNEEASRITEAVMTDEVTVQPTYSLFGKRIELSDAEIAEALATTAADNSCDSPSQAKLNE